MQCNMHLTASHLLWPLFRDSPPSVTRQNARRGLSAAASNLGGSALQWRPSATGLGALSRACPLPSTFAADGAPLQQAHLFGLSVRISTPRVAPEGTGGYARSIQQAHLFGLSVRISTPRVAPEGTGGYAPSIQQAHLFGLSVRISTPRAAPEGTGGYARSIQLQHPALGASLNGTSGQGTHSPPGSSRDTSTRPVPAPSPSATFAALGFSAGSGGPLASPS